MKIHSYLVLTGRNDNWGRFNSWLTASLRLGMLGAYSLSLSIFKSPSVYRFRLAGGGEISFLVLARIDLSLAGFSCWTNKRFIYQHNIFHTKLAIAPITNPLKLCATIGIFQKKKSNGRNACVSWFFFFFLAWSCELRYGNIIGNINVDEVCS